MCARVHVYEGVVQVVFASLFLHFMRINELATTTMTAFDSRLAATFQDNMGKDVASVDFIITERQVDRWLAAVCRLYWIIKVSGRFVPDILFRHQSSQVSSAVDLSGLEDDGKGGMD